MAGDAAVESGSNLRIKVMLRNGFPMTKTVFRVPMDVTLSEKVFRVVASHGGVV